MSTDKIVTGEEILLIKRTNIVRSYKSDSEGFKGMSYRLYVLGGKAFAVHQDDTFHRALENGEIKTIAITVTEEGYALSNFVSWKQAIAQRGNQLAFDALTVESFKGIKDLNSVPSL